VDRKAMENHPTLTSGKQTAQLMDRNAQNAIRRDTMQGFVSQDRETRRMKLSTTPGRQLQDPTTSTSTE
jgi:hypothetical protein